MTHAASAPTVMRLRTIATLFAVSAVILTGSPAFASSRHATHSQTIESLRSLRRMRAARHRRAALERREHDARQLAEQHDPRITPDQSRRMRGNGSAPRSWWRPFAVGSRNRRTSISSEARYLN